MAEIKRPNYFTGQFLLEGDFKDEQAYHLGMRRRLNRGLHTPGVAEGFELTYVDTTHVQIGPGVAIDKDGREIVLVEALVYPLRSVGSSGRWVLLTVEYDEEEVDRYDQGGGNQFTRIAERTRFGEVTEWTPADASVPVGLIQLNSAGVIESSGSIYQDWRLFAGARLAPQSVEEAHLADGSVTLGKLAHEARPVTLVPTNAITVTPNDSGRTVTVGESHSARTDNPHDTTAQQIDTQGGGTNRIVAQINAGSGIISRSRIETSIVSGVVTFTNLGAEEQFSEVDPGLGAGTVCVQLGVETASMTHWGTETHARCFAQVDYRTGRFWLFASRAASAGRGEVRVRWYAFKPILGTDSSVSVSVAVTPSSVFMASHATQLLTATSTNTDAPFSWTIMDANGGSLVTSGGNVATYTAPANSATYRVKVASVADPSKFAIASIVVTGSIEVNISPLRVDQLLSGGQVTLSANVINTTNTGIQWSVVPASGGGTLTANADGSRRYTAPASPGSYSVIARSVADPNKSATCWITVHAVTLSVTPTPDTETLAAGGVSAITASISPAFADQGVTWSKTGPGTLSAQGSTATYTAPSSTSGSSVTIRATRVADSTQFREVTLTVNGTGGGGGSDPDPVPTPPDGKFAAVAPGENVTPPPGPMPPAETALAPAPASELEAKARTFVRPHKRPKPKSSKRDDE